MPVNRRELRDPKDTRATLIYVMTLFLGCGLVVIMQGHWVAKNKDIYLGKPADQFRNGPNGSSLVQCSHCSYQGRVLVDEVEVMCPICYGVGGHYVKRRDTGEQFCALCDGMGRILDGAGVSSQSCPVCRGRGVKRLAYGLAFCPNCEGAGYEFNEETDEQRDCPLCSGSGNIFQDVAFCQSCKGTQTRVDPETQEVGPCPACTESGAPPVPLEAEK